MDTAPIPDVAGQDLPQPPNAEALAYEEAVKNVTAFAAGVEKDNDDRLKRLAALGLAPASFREAALALRLEVLIDSLPPFPRAKLEADYEVAMAQMLDQAIEERSKPRLLTPGE